SLVLAADTRTPGSASVTLNLTSGFISVALQALAAGAQVPITISSPGVDSVTTSIQTSSPVATFRFGSNSPGNPSAPISLGLNESLFVNTTIGSDISPNGFYIPNPGTPAPQFGLQPSDSSLVKITSSGTSFTVLTLAEGSTMLTAQPPAGIPL